MFGRRGSTARPGRDGPSPRFQNYHTIYGDEPSPPRPGKVELIASPVEIRALDQAARCRQLPPSPKLRRTRRQAGRPPSPRLWRTGPPLQNSRLQAGAHDGRMTHQTPCMVRGWWLKRRERRAPGSSPRFQNYHTIIIIQSMGTSRPHPYRLWRHDAASFRLRQSYGGQDGRRDVRRRQGYGGQARRDKTAGCKPALMTDG